MYRLNKPVRHSNYRRWLLPAAVLLFVLIEFVMFLNALNWAAEIAIKLWG